MKSKKVLFILFILLFVMGVSGCSISENLESKKANIKSAFELGKDSKRFRMLLGDYYVKTKNFKQATEGDDSYNYLLRKDATNIEVNIALANAYIKWGDYIKAETDKQLDEKLDKYNQAEIILNDLLKYHQDNPKILFEIAKIQIRKMDKKSFETSFLEAYKKDKTFKTIEHTTAGEIAEYLMTIPNRSKAEALLKQVIGTGSREPKVHYELAKIFIMDDSLNEAEEELIRAKSYCQEKRIDPEDASPIMWADDRLISSILNELGELYLIRANRMDITLVEGLPEREKFLNLANGHFLEAISYDGSNSKPLKNLGDMYYIDLTGANRKLKINEAISNYTKAMSKMIGLENITDLNTIILKANERGLSDVEAELFYKLGYLFYSKASDLKGIEPESSVEEYYIKARDCFSIAYSRSNQEQRDNPTLNFAIGNVFYLTGKYENAVSHYNNVAKYYQQILNEKYKTKEDSDKNKKRINYELARSINNLGATQFMIFDQTKDKSYFGMAKGNFLEAQEYYYKYNRSIVNPKAENLRNLFEDKNINIALNEDLLGGSQRSSERQVKYIPQIYDDINNDITDFIK